MIILAKHFEKARNYKLAAMKRFMGDKNF